MTPLLSPAELESALATLPGWNVADGQIAKTFAFPAYASGLAFAVAAGHLADRADHHPDLAIGYRRVEVRLSTHDAGGITARDVDLARAIEALA